MWFSWIMWNGFMEFHLSNTCLAFFRKTLITCKLSALLVCHAEIIRRGGLDSFRLANDISAKSVASTRSGEINCFHLLKGEAGDFKTNTF